LRLAAHVKGTYLKQCERVCGAYNIYIYTYI